MRNQSVKHNLLSISAGQMEPGLNQPVVPDASFRVDVSSILAISRRTETDEGEATGTEEVTTIYDLGAGVEQQLNFAKLQPQFLAAFAAYALGSISTSDLGGGAYQHTITPIDGDLAADRSNPMFTAVQRLGNSVIKGMFASLGVDSLSLKASADDWMGLTVGVKGTGKAQDNLIREQVSGNSDDTTITLAANAVEGASAAERLGSIHQVRFQQTGQSYWTEADIVSASDATPAVITIDAISAASNAGTWEVLYVPDEDTTLITGSATSDPPADTTGVLEDSAQTMIADEHIGRQLVMTSGTASGMFYDITDNAVDSITLGGNNLYADGVRSGDTYVIRQIGWLPQPAYTDQPPLRTSQLNVNIGGEYNGTSFVGGRAMKTDLNEISWDFSNTLQMVQGPGAGTSKVANQALRDGRSQTVSMTRRMVDALYQHMLLEDAETFAAVIEAQGPEIGSSGEYYGIKIIWPKLQLQDSERGTSGKRLSESPKLAVLEDATYGSVIVIVTDNRAAYMA